MFIRAVRSEKEILYIEENKDYIYHVIKKGNADNEIIFLLLDTMKGLPNDFLWFRLGIDRYIGEVLEWRTMFDTSKRFPEFYMRKRIMVNVIEIKGISKNYGDFKLDDVSFSVPEGSVCGFISQNGAGKTTTIWITLDAINRDGGEVYVFGKSMNEEEAAFREDIGVIFDEMRFHGFLTAAQINTIMKNIYKTGIRKRILNIADFVPSR